MAWYDFFSTFYDSALDAVYAEHRALAVEALRLAPGMSVLDLPCGTGPSFAPIARGLGGSGTIVGVDASAGMLRKAGARGAAIAGVRIVTTAGDVHALTPEVLASAAGLRQVDRLHVFLGMSTFPEMDAAFEQMWNVLAPGGRAVIVDVHAERLGFQGWMVNRIARADIRRRFWEPLSARAVEFERRDLPFNAKHGGQIMLATGRKPT